MYEYTTQVHVAKGGQVSGGVMPVQVCFILKEQNKKKLNSHRWFVSGNRFLLTAALELTPASAQFNAVCNQLNPHVGQSFFVSRPLACADGQTVSLIDVGTRPSATSLYHLWKEFDKHKSV